MTNRKFTLPALALAALVGAGGPLSIGPVPALAQASNPPAGQAAPGQPQPPRPRPMRPSHIEGRIAYIKAELKITPAQEAAFDKIAEALRKNDGERRQSFEQASNRGQPQTALQSLERISRLSALRTQENDRFLAAFRPLYDSLSDAQKKAADDIWGFHRFYGRGHFRRG